MWYGFEGRGSTAEGQAGMYFGQEMDSHSVRAAAIIGEDFLGIST